MNKEIGIMNNTHNKTQHIIAFLFFFDKQTISLTHNCFSLSNIIKIHQTKSFPSLPPKSLFQTELKVSH